MATPSSVHLFQAATKLREARRELAKAEGVLQDINEVSEVKLLREEVSDLNWRTQSLAMGRERAEKPGGPWTPATDFPDYDAEVLKGAAETLQEEATDLDLRADSLPMEPTRPDGDGAGPVRRAVEKAKAAAKALLSRLMRSTDG
jgi:hypothetical protein